MKYYCSDITNDCNKYSKYEKKCSKIFKKGEDGRLC